jgi:hypothetical protein
MRRMTAKTEPAVLSARALNRALLARQLLLEREPRPAVDTVAHLVGVQAQSPTDPYFGLRARLQPFDPGELVAALTDRRVARMSLQRSTIHLATADDCLALRPVLQVVHDRALQGNFGRYLEGVDLAEVAQAGRELLDTAPLAFSELGRRLAGRWAGRDPLALAMVVRTRVPLVQPPPRGVWGASGRALHSPLESWLERPLGPPIALEDMVVRYLAAFGPATPNDAQIWCGLTRLRDVFERLRPRLVTFRDERGAELFDLPDAPRPDVDTPAPPRFLPEFDNVLLSHADRTRIAPPGVGERIYNQHGHWYPLLIDGFLAGTWKLRKGSLAIELADPLEAHEEAAVREEAAQLLAFAAPQATHEVQFLS